MELENRGRKEKVSVQFDFDKVLKARESALTLVGANPTPDVNRLLDSENLEDVENGIKQLNSMSRKAWLLSSILLYTLVYDQNLYTQSGLTWEEYVRDAKTRLDMDARDISEQLSSAKFFIEHHDSLIRKGYEPKNLITLARAQLALELSGDIDAVTDHLASGESFADFKEWYSSFKPATILPQLPEGVRTDIVVSAKTVKIGGIDAVHISDELPQEEKARLQGYIQQIYMAIKDGYEPAIVPVYDRKEAVNLIRLRDKYRQGK